jgi:hypothetical protein
LNGCLGFRTMSMDGLLCGIVKTFHYFKFFFIRETCIFVFDESLTVFLKKAILFSLL